jgi:hypothetical protein
LEAGGEHVGQFLGEQDDFLFLEFDRAVRDGRRLRFGFVADFGG